MTYNKLSVCLVTCYRTPGYVRVKSLEAGLLANDVDLSIVRNKQRSCLRYIEVALKLIKNIIFVKPDIYFVTFRGYEILPIVLLVGIGKKVVFDEFVNLIGWTVFEHKKLKQNSFATRSLTSGYRFLLKRTTRIILDTKSHAEYSASLMKLPIGKYQSVPVGTDEEVFNSLKSLRKDNGKFQVLYYGSMLPLHGIDYVIESAVNLQNRKDIEFSLIGGGTALRRSVDVAISKGANIKYQKWVPYAELPQVIADADICLGGPFGGTTQSQFVVTGKTIQFLRMGKPVIVGKNKESGVFKDKINVLIIDQASSKSLEKAIVWAYKNKKSIKKIGKNGIKLYNDCFSNKVVAKSIEKLLDSIRYR